MKITEIRYERLVNLGNFSHAKGGVTIALNEDDSPVQAFAMARHIVKAQIMEENEKMAARGMFDE